MEKVSDRPQKQAVFFSSGLDTRGRRRAGESVPGLSSRKVTYVSGQGNNMRYEQYARLADGAWSMTCLLYTSRCV